MVSNRHPRRQYTNLPLSIKQITISSSTKKNSNPYKLHVQYKSAAGKVLQEKQFEAPFPNWFSADGVFHPEPFRRWLASEVDVLRLAAKENEKKTGGVSGLVGKPDDAADGKMRR